MTDKGLDRWLPLVAVRRRRRLLRQFRFGATAETTVDELADQLLSTESVAETEPTLDRDQLAMHLYHVDLPMLADHGVVEFDPEAGTVKYRATDQIETVLDSLPDSGSTASP